MNYLTKELAVYLTAILLLHVMVHILRLSIVISVRLVGNRFLLPESSTYSLYIDSKYGTFNLSIDDSKTASEFINKAVADVKAGRDVEFPQYTSIFGNDHSVQSAGVPLSQRTQGVGEWTCPKCGKINQNYVGTCGCGQVKPR